MSKPKGPWVPREKPKMNWMVLKAEHLSNGIRAEVYVQCAYGRDRFMWTVGNVDIFADPPFASGFEDTLEAAQIAAEVAVLAERAKAEKEASK